LASEIIWHLAFLISWIMPSGMMAPCNFAPVGDDAPRDWLLAGLPELGLPGSGLPSSSCLAQVSTSEVG